MGIFGGVSFRKVYPRKKVMEILNENPNYEIEEVGNGMYKFLKPHEVKTKMAQVKQIRENRTFMENQRNQFKDQITQGGTLKQTCGILSYSDFEEKKQQNEKNKIETEGRELA